MDGPTCMPGVARVTPDFRSRNAKRFQNCRLWYVQPQKFVCYFHFLQCKVEVAICRFQKKPDRFQSGPVRQSKSMDRIRFQSDPVPFGSGVQKPELVYPVPDRIQSGSVPRTGRTGSKEPVVIFLTVGISAYKLVA